LSEVFSAEDLAKKVKQQYSSRGQSIADELNSKHLDTVHNITRMQAARLSRVAESGRGMRENSTGSRDFGNFSANTFGGRVQT
jgi:hypothetical protein